MSTRRRKPIKRKHGASGDSSDDEPVTPGVGAFDGVGAFYGVGGSCAGGDNEAKVPVALHGYEKVQEFFKLTQGMERIDQQSRKVMFNWLFSAIELCLQSNITSDNRQLYLDAILQHGVLDYDQQSQDYDQFGLPRDDIKPVRDQLWKKGLVTVEDDTSGEIKTSVDRTVAFVKYKTGTAGMPDFNPPLHAKNEAGKKIEVTQVSYELIRDLFDEEALPGSLRQMNSGRWEFGFFELLHFAKSMGCISTFGNLFPSQGKSRSGEDWLLRAIDKGLKVDKGPYKVTTYLFNCFNPKK